MIGMKCYRCRKSFLYLPEKEAIKFVEYVNIKDFRRKLFCSEKCLDEYLKKEKEDG